MDITRSGFCRAVAALVAAPFAQARRKTAVTAWDTPQGQYVLLLRAELEKLGYFDDLKEDWEEVEVALSNGHRFFAPLPSRWDTRAKRLLQSVRPVYPVVADCTIPPVYGGYLDWRTHRAVRHQ